MEWPKEEVQYGEGTLGLCQIAAKKWTEADSPIIRFSRSRSAIAAGALSEQ